MEEKGVENLCFPQQIYTFVCKTQNACPDRSHGTVACGTIPAARSLRADVAADGGGRRRRARRRRKTTKSNYENRHSRSRRDGQPSGDDAERQRSRHHGHRPRRQGARRGGDAGRHHHRRGGLDHLRGAAQGLDTQVRSLHRGEPHRKRQHRRGGDRQAARCAQNHRPHRQQRVSRTQQQGDFHRNGNRLPFLSRKGRGGRGGRSAGAHLDDRIRGFFRRTAFAVGLQVGTYLSARRQGAGRLFGQ